MQEPTTNRRHLYTFRAVGIPKGQPRPRAFARNGRASVYDPGTAEGWKSCVAIACEELEGQCLFSALSVTLVFYMPRPKSHFRTNGELRPNAPDCAFTQKPDVDNMAKAVLDALTVIRAWVDDSVVAELVARKFYETPENPPGCVISIREFSTK